MTEAVRDASAPTYVVGLMSGTSLDGIAAAVVRFEQDTTHGRLDAQLLAYSHRAFAPAERARLEQAMLQGSARDYCRLHVDMGHWLADAALAALAETDIPRDSIACIASHGQTLWHEPGHSTWQIGDAATIAERTGCAVIADFRARDVAAGGQGAPLVPIADALLFADETAWCALQNIGGIGNVTVVPPYAAGAQQLDGVRAFDTGPGVVVIDSVVRALFPSLSYDIDGTIAREGHPVRAVVDNLLTLPWFLQEPPKSTGRELFSRAFIDRFITTCREHDARDADVVATAVAFTARSISEQYARFIPEPVSEVLLSGGGARNPALVDAIRTALPIAMTARGGTPPRVSLFSDRFFDGEAKEAVAFALLGYLALMREPANVPRATGARGPRKLGVMVPA